MERIPHFATVSYAFRNRFDTETVEGIFEWILREIEKAGYLSPEVVYVDGTHVKANANLKKQVKKQILNAARADIKGGKGAEGLFGEALFVQKQNGVLVTVRVKGLPSNNRSGFFALHIHEGGSCIGQGFPGTGSHFHPDSVPHPQHAGALPPHLDAGGEAYMQVLTTRFTVKEIVGKTIVIHNGPDDFTSQPAGNAGEKIACGVIR